MRLALSALALAALPAAATAQTPLERLETATETLGDNMEAFYLSRLPELQDRMPDWTWDPQYRQAGACVLEGIRSVRGEEGVTAYVAAMEERAEIEFESFDDMAQDYPDALTGELIRALTQACGLVEISTRRMQDSGLLAAMQDQETVQALTAE